MGRLVARQLGLGFVDTDEAIEAKASRRISEIFATEGELAFRALERQVLEDLTAREGLVIATGGGLICQPGNLEILQQRALVICLWASAETIWERVKHQTHRPLLQVADPQAEISRLLAIREPFLSAGGCLGEFRPAQFARGFGAGGPSLPRGSTGRLRAMKARIVARAAELGFDLCGICEARRSPHGEALRQWLAEGCQGGMAYLERTAASEDPQLVLEGARSAVVLAVSYHDDAAVEGDLDTTPRGVVARYARHRDYHDLLLARVSDLSRYIGQLGGPSVRSLGYVDTGPVLERDLGSVPELDLSANTPT